MLFSVLGLFCVLADKLMEETEELCLQREQKEVSSSQAKFLQLLCGRAGKLGVVGLKVHKCSGREVCGGGTRVSSQPLGPEDEERSKTCAMRWIMEVYPCSLSLLLPKKWVCHCDSRRTREEDQTKFILTGLNYTIVIWQIQEDCGN